MTNNSLGQRLFDWYYDRHFIEVTLLYVFVPPFVILPLLFVFGVFK